MLGFARRIESETAVGQMADIFFRPGKREWKEMGSSEKFLLKEMSVGTRLKEGCSFKE